MSQPPNLDLIANKVIEAWMLKKDQSRLMISMNLEEQIECLLLLKKMRAKS